MKSRINKSKYRLEIINNYGRYYLKNNDFHREKDLPAVIWEDGSKFWLKNGSFHRDNGKPSHIYPSGKVAWWENGNFIKDNRNEI